MTRVHVIVPSWECADFLPQCLESIESQDYPNLRVVVIDDASTDERHRELVQEVNVIDGWTGILNNRRVGAACNIWRAVHEYTIGVEPDDIYLLVDADDWLSDPHAVSTIAAAYDDDPNLLMAYGSYASVPHDDGCSPAAPFPLEVIRERSFRTCSFNLLNHPLSFRKCLADQITGADLRRADGSWVQFVYDEAWGYPMLEMAGPNVRCMSEVTYCYRSNSPLSCNREHAEEMRDVGAELRNRPRKPRLYRDGTTFTLSDVERHELIVAAMTDHGLSLLIELGTGHPDIAEQVAASDSVERVVTVEPDDARYVAATERTIVNAKVQTIYGERNDWLRRCAERVDRPACWFIAASAVTLDELLLILARPAAGAGRDCILIEDARLFGRPGNATLEEVRGQVANLGAVAGHVYDVRVEYDMVHVTPKGVGCG